MPNLSPTGTRKWHALASIYIVTFLISKWPFWYLSDLLIYLSDLFDIAKWPFDITGFWQVTRKWHAVTRTLWHDFQKKTSRSHHRQAIWHNFGCDCWETQIYHNVGSGPFCFATIWLGKWFSPTWTQMVLIANCLCSCRLISSNWIKIMYGSTVPQPRHHQFRICNPKTLESAGCSLPWAMGKWICPRTWYRQWFAMGWVMLTLWYIQPRV